MAQAFRSTRVLTPQGIKPATIIEHGGLIVDLRGWNEDFGDADLHDFGDLVLLPGLIDSHVHINEPGRSDWEGFWTATRAAAAGGVTALVDMPLNCVPETIDVVSLNAKREAAEGKAWVDWAAWGGVVRGNAASLKPLAAAGVLGFKCFLIDSGINGFDWVDEAELRLALQQLRGTGLPLLVHAEVAGPVDHATRNLHASGKDWRKYDTYLASRPDEAETAAISLLIRLAEEFSTPIHVVHLASAQVLQMLADARGRGVPITVETCTQYLWFEAEKVPDGATEFKCAPPIRSRENKERLWQAIQDGIIDFVVTDHSPCPPEMKHTLTGRWDQAWGGIASLGLALPVLWTGMKQRGINLEQIGVWMGTGPAHLAGLDSMKGTLKVGADADIVAFNPEQEWTVTPDDLHFRHKISPYLGTKLAGRVMQTWLRGQKIFHEGEFVNVESGRELVKR